MAGLELFGSRNGVKHARSGNVRALRKRQIGSEDVDEPMSPEVRPSFRTGRQSQIGSQRWWSIGRSDVVLIRALSSSRQSVIHTMLRYDHRSMRTDRRRSAIESTITAVGSEALPPTSWRMAPHATTRAEEQSRLTIVTAKTRERVTANTALVGHAGALRSSLNRAPRVLEVLRGARVYAVRGVNARVAIGLRWRR